MSREEDHRASIRQVKESWRRHTQKRFPPSLHPLFIVLLLLLLLLVQESVRISDGVSSTQAELQAILRGLQIISGGSGDVDFFVDSQAALLSLNSPTPVLQKVVEECKNIIVTLREGQRNITFSWIPSHIGIQGNERADHLAQEGTKKEDIEQECALSMKQIRTIIRTRLINEQREEYAVRYENSATFHHYTAVLNNTNFTYGRYRCAWKDAVCTRLRLGYKYLWQLGVDTNEEEVRCRLCGEPRSHSLPHYVLHCPLLAPYRNPAIQDVTSQVTWIFNNTLSDIINKIKDIKYIVR